MSLTDSTERERYAGRLRQVLLYLVVQAPDGTALPTTKISLPRLPAVGVTLRPPNAPRACFVTRAVPSSLQETGDIRVAGWVYADAIDGQW